MSRTMSMLAAGLACLAAPALAAGPYVAERPQAHLGRVVGLGHCVDFVKAAAGVPRTAAWRPGAKVLGNTGLPPGVAIATFERDGSYTSRTGNHAAIYVGQDHRGIWVYDQWRGQPVHKRLIRLAGGLGSKSGSKSNDASRYRVIN